MKYREDIAEFEARAIAEIKAEWFDKLPYEEKLAFRWDVSTGHKLIVFYAASLALSLAGAICVSWHPVMAFMLVGLIGWLGWAIVTVCRVCRQAALMGVSACRPIRPSANRDLADLAHLTDLEAR
jgi:hypothetical protein